jgi:hypothetical protein
MIAELDDVLRRLLGAAFDPPPNDAWIRFQPPDDKWRQYVSSLNHTALNVYLVDLRENRTLHSNERIRTYTGIGAVDLPAPRRLTCHYLVSAWHPAAPSVQVDPAPEEHELLYRATALLINADPLVPEQVYAPGQVPPQFDPEFSKTQLPITVVPVDGFPKYAEFWGTMGQDHPWKPAVYLTVTVPVMLLERFSGPEVTTRVTTYRQAGDPQTVEVWVQIGGRVRTAAGKELAGAWATLETAPGGPVAQTRCDDRGGFTFDRLHPGPYRLRARAQGYAEVVRDIDAPSTTGEYDLTVS